MRRPVQRCEADLVARVGVRAGVEECRDDRRCLALCRPVQRCSAVPVARVGVRAGVEEGRDDRRCLAECRRPVQRCAAVPVARVGVRARAQTGLNSGGSCSFKKRRCGPIVASDLSGKGRYDTQCEKPGYGEERQM